MKTKPTNQTESRTYAQRAQDVKALIQSSLKHSTCIREQNMEYIQKDFNAWIANLAEETFTHGIKIKFYESILKEFSKADEYHYELILQEHIATLERFTTRYWNVRTGSSNVIVSEQSTWEFITNMQLLEWTRDWVNHILDKQ